MYAYSRRDIYRLTAAYDFEYGSNTKVFLSHENNLLTHKSGQDNWQLLASRIDFSVWLRKCKCLTTRAGYATSLQDQEL